MNPYAANFQVPVPSAAPTATGTTAVVGVGQGLGGGGEASDQGGQEAGSWAEDPSQNDDGAGGYWDEHGQHHPGYGGEYDPAAGVYHPDGYDPAYHQVGGANSAVGPVFMLLPHSAWCNSTVYFCYSLRTAHSINGRKCYARCTRCC